MLLELFHSVQPTLESTIHLTHSNKNVVFASKFVWAQTAVMSAVSYPSAVAFKCNLTSHKLSGNTRDPLTVLRRSSPKKEPPLYSRVLVQTLFVLLDPLLFLFFTEKSRRHCPKQLAQIVFRKKSTKKLLCALFISLLSRLTMKGHDQ